MTQREIKFRAWNETNNEMIYPKKDYFYTGLTYGNLVDQCDNVMQYIGFNDKNGTEIYEGDVVNFAVKSKLCPTCCDKDVESRMKLGTEQFCPTCGTKTQYGDFITTAKVVFRKGAFAYHYTKQQEYYQSWATYAAESYIEWVEVIGNIHQNPELCPTTETL